MQRPRRPFSRLQLAGFWLLDYGGALLVAAGLCGTFAVLGLFVVRATKGPESTEEAQVLRFGYYDGKLVHRPIVIVRMRDGAVRQLMADPQQLRYCRKGDTITLLHRGAALFVHRQGCLDPTGAERHRT